MAVGNTKGHLGRSVKSQEDQVTAMHCSNSTAVRTNRVALSAWAVCPWSSGDFTHAVQPESARLPTHSPFLLENGKPPQQGLRSFGLFLFLRSSFPRLAAQLQKTHTHSAAGSPATGPQVSPEGPGEEQHRAMRVAKERDVPSTQTPATDPSPTRPKAAWFFLFV